MALVSVGCDFFSQINFVVKSHFACLSDAFSQSLCVFAGCVLAKGVGRHRQGGHGPPGPKILSF